VITDATQGNGICHGNYLFLPVNSAEMLTDPRLTAVQTWNPMFRSTQRRDEGGNICPKTKIVRRSVSAAEGQADSGT
jgi:hypothetical protein